MKTVVTYKQPWRQRTS